MDDAGADMKVLMIDDHALSRRVVGDFMERLGHEVETYASIDEYVQAVGGEQGGEQDVVLIDPIGPVHKALEVVKRVHELLPDALQVIMSFMDNVLTAEDSVEHYVFSYLKKPVRLSELELVLIRVAEARARK